MIRLNQLTKVYPHPVRPVTALKSVTLTLTPGSFSLLMGPSGCGKSTLLNLIGGLDRPTSGTLEIDGQSTEHLSDAAWTTLRRNKIGMIFQFFNLLPMLTALENVALPLLLRGDPRKIALAKASAALAAVGMADGASSGDRLPNKNRADHLPAALSGGEMQRVAIARANVISPAILLADEPTGNLDSQLGEEITRLLAARVRHAGVTLLLATHHLQTVPYADQILWMKDGEITQIEKIAH